MKRILFVDDEPRVLAGLRRMLYGQRREWEMVFAASGEEALAELEKAPCDVVVSDMRMPGMDGATLLKHVRERFPDTIRIVLSGQTEAEAALRAAPVAQQFLTKPCDATRLKESVTRACNLRALLADRRVRSAVGEVGALPPVPRVYAQLTQALSDPNSSTGQIAQVVEQDVAIAAKVLQVVNSAFFGLPRCIAGVQEAVTYLGTDTLKVLVLSLEVDGLFVSAAPLPGFSLEGQQAHALLAACVARRLLSEKRAAEEAFTAAMLHDVGKLVLATRLPEPFAAALVEARETGRPLHVVEAEMGGGITHAEVGAYLLGVWGLPYPVVEAVAHHHTPERVEHQGFGVLDAVHIADCLARECGASPPTEEEARAALDPAYIESLGVSDRLPSWRRLAEEQARAMAGAMQ